MRRKIKSFSWLIILLSLLLLLAGCQSGVADPKINLPQAPMVDFGEEKGDTATKPETGGAETATEPEGDGKLDGQEKIEIGNESSAESLLKVHFIDIGQGDANLIQLPSGQTMLIDGGEASKYKILKAYLEKQQINKIDYLIATHPHADHIGGLINVIKDFEVGKIYAPKVSHNTDTYLKFLEAIQEKELKISSAKAGLNLDLGEGVEAVFVAPTKDKYESINNYSAVLKLTYGEVSFLFTGDAEKESEAEMLAGEIDLRATILKVGHHGSSTSNTQAFLEKVKPDYGIISLEEGNSYGHPHQEVLDRLTENGITILRTDQVSNIIITADDKMIVGFSMPDNPNEEG